MSTSKNRGNSSPDNRDESGDRRFKKNAVEWSVFTVSLVLVTAVTAYLGYEAFHESGREPTFTFEFGAPSRQDSLYVLPVTVRNTGDQTAADVHVAVAGGAEEAQIVFDYVPRHSAREGAALFRTPPRSPQARVQSYSRP